jgi:hypothetical protein
MKSIAYTTLKKSLVRAGATALTALAVAGGAVQPAVADDTISFDMVRPAALAAFPNCLPNVHAHVTIIPGGPVDQLIVKAVGLPPNTDFDFFVIQVPKAPFGMSWYQGDFESNSGGAGLQTYVGRFSIETFVVAPGTAPAPVVFNNAFPDASSNPATAPIHTYHLGMWFNSPQDAVKAGCPGTVTPFNGEHNAGVQILNTSNFPDLQGPLLQVH